jgi:hypothetical protein
VRLHDGDDGTADGEPTMAKTGARLHYMAHGGVVHPTVKVTWVAEHRNGVAMREVGLTIVRWWSGEKRRCRGRRWLYGGPTHTAGRKGCVTTPKRRRG